MKKRMAGIVSLLCLLAAYAAIRYPLFAWHGMKGFPLYLLVPGVAAVAYAGLVRGNRVVPVFTAAGYILGFFCGHLFAAPAFDPGGGLTSNMWAIWLCVYGGAMATGALAAAFYGRRAKPRTRAPGGRQRQV
nr:hypothetical protein [Maliibacterium massiliense]